MNFWDWLFGRKKKKKESVMITKDEKYWETKHPFVRKLYSGRPLPNGEIYEIDVRHFIWPEDSTLNTLVYESDLRSENNDETVHNIQSFVCKYLEYKSDKTLGTSEYWLFPAETFAMKHGDCEDGAILMASMILNALPIEHHWRVRVAAGFVQSPNNGELGGHAYVTYCRCTDNEWVILDWCYYPDPQVSIARKPMAKDVKIYNDIWFSFNHKHAWSHKDFELSGRVKNVQI